MLAIDLFCGTGGWTDGFLAQGYEVRGYDLVRHPLYRGEMIIGDVQEIDGRELRGARVIVASPPCQEFSRHDLPWTRGKQPPPPDLALIHAARRIAGEAGVPLILENVRGAQRWIGRAAAHIGPYYLWGDGVPLLLPSAADLGVRHKSRYSSARADLRARIPLVLAEHVARVYASAG